MTTTINTTVINHILVKSIALANLFCSTYSSLYGADGISGSICDVLGFSGTIVGSYATLLGSYPTLPGSFCVALEFSGTPLGSNGTPPGFGRAPLGWYVPIG